MRTATPGAERRLGTHGAKAGGSAGLGRLRGALVPAATRKTSAGAVTLAESPEAGGDANGSAALERRLPRSAGPHDATSSHVILEPPCGYYPRSAKNSACPEVQRLAPAFRTRQRQGRTRIQVCRTPKAGAFDPTVCVCWVGTCRDRREDQGG